METPILSSSARVFGSMAKVMDGSEVARRIINRRTFIAESFARRGFLQFGNRADVSRMKLADFGELLALNNLDMLEAFREVAIVIDERGVVLQDAALT